MRLQTKRKLKKKKNKINEVFAKSEVYIDSRRCYSECQLFLSMANRHVLP